MEKIKDLLLTCFAKNMIIEIQLKKKLKLDCNTFNNVLKKFIKYSIYTILECNNILVVGLFLINMKNNLKLFFFMFFKELGYILK